MVKKFGPRAVPAIELPQVLHVRTAFGGRDTPVRANRAVRILSILLENSRAIGWRKDNPALRPKRLRSKSDGYPTWTTGDFAAFMAHPDVTEPMKRAAALAYYTGLRVGDLVALPRAARVAGTIATRTAKTGARVRVAEHPELTRALDAAPVSSAKTLLTRADGQPWKLDHIKHAMTAAVAAAGLPPGRSFHGLRKALHAALAEAGATDAGIEAVVPHADPAMTRHYRRGADQTVLAAAAMAKLPGWGSTGHSLPTETANTSPVETTHPVTR